MRLSPGVQLGHYRIVAHLSTGGMGEVYKARDMRLEREVAIKILSEHLAAEVEALKRFEREAKVVAALSHPNILDIHDFGSDQGLAYAVMELLEGETLRSFLRRSPLPLDKTLQIGVSIAEGLAAAHSKGVIHRDLKPENIFLTSDGRVKILDFGLARLKPVLREQEFSQADTKSVETETGLIRGTVPYMSPEQVRGLALDARSDLFSLGCILYEMLSGKRAFYGETAADTMSAILKDEPPIKELPLELQEVVKHCLEKNPEQRFHSAHDLAFALEAVSQGADSAKTILEKPRAAVRLSHLNIWIIAGLVSLLASIIIYLYPRSGDAIDSVAVLPFLNATGDSEMEYLSDGLTVNLINSLTDLRQLGVKSRHAVFRYKGRNGDPQDAGRELGVKGVITGTVGRRGKSLLVGVELVDTNTGNQLWGAQFSRPSSDMFALEEDIARSIVKELSLRLTPESDRRLSKRYTDNIDAYHLYLRGSFYAGTFRQDGLKRAIDYYRKALALDRNYALAYTGLAHAYFWFTDWYAPSKEVSPLAIDAARKALDIDGNLPDAHSMLGLVTFVYEWDWPLAEREFVRALELNPKDARTRAYYAWLLVILGRAEKAIAEVKRAEETESLSAEVSTIVGLVFYLARLHDQAVASERHAIDLDPEFTWAYIIQGRALEAQGRLKEAIPVLEQARKLESELPEALASLGHAYAIAGRTSEAQKILAELMQLSDRRHVAPLDIATVHIGLGDRKSALDWLERSYNERSYLMPSIGRLHFFDELRSDPRFQHLLLRINLPASASGMAFDSEIRNLLPHSQRASGDVFRLLLSG